MEITTAYTLVSRSYGKAASDTALPAPDTAPKSVSTGDRIEVSDEALHSARALEVSDGAGNDASLQVVRSAVALVSGSDVTAVQVTAAGEDGAGDEAAHAAGYQEDTLKMEAASLSVAGTISTRDGKDLGFTLDLLYDHLSYAGQSVAVAVEGSGGSLEYAGIAADLTSTSFNFTIASAGGSGPVTGKGRLHLNDEVSRVAKELKPAAKEFMSSAGLPGGWGVINRFLRSGTRQ